MKCRTGAHFCTTHNLGGSGNSFFFANANFNGTTTVQLSETWRIQKNEEGKPKVSQPTFHQILNTSALLPPAYQKTKDGHFFGLGFDCPHF